MAPALLLALALLAQRPSHGDAPRIVQAAPATDAISIDGFLDEAAWAAAEVAADFRQFEPDEGAPASLRTEVRVLYGPTALYVGAVLYDDEPSRIRRTLTRRDDPGDADAFLVALDGFLDGRTAYLFGVTAAGVQIDAVQEGNNTDASWDAVWASAVRVTPEGWVAEIAIPYTMLRFPTAEVQTWGVQFQRTIPRRSEEAYWEPVTRAAVGTGPILGRLAGLRGIQPRRNVQVRPYALSRARTFEDAAQPGRRDGDLGADVGVDLKVGLASNLILDATINPDFGQVEADPAVLNLTTFETFFDERRPFFLEGTSIFDYTIDSGIDGSLLYTRRVGAFDPIIGAAKLSGRSAGGRSVGALAAVTGGDLEPQRFYGTARVKQELGPRRFVGTGVTVFDGPEAGGRRRAIVGGGDFDIRLGGDTYNWDGALTVSHRDRPGGGATGFGFYTGFDRVRGTATFGTGVRVYSDDFDPNDVGRLRENDHIRALAGGQVFLNGARPFGPFRRASVGAFSTVSWTYRDRTPKGGTLDWFSTWALMDFSEINLSGTVGGLWGYDVRETRGLGPVRTFRFASASLAYTTDSRQRFVLTPEVGVEAQEGGGFGWGAGLDLSWNARDWLSLAFEAGYQEQDGFTAWAANEALRRTEAGFQIGAADGPPDALGPDDYLGFEDNGALAALLAGVPVYGGIDGAYYLPVFAARDTRQAEAALRANVVFHPGLSLQLYSQLFAARGRHRDFQLLTTPEDLHAFAAYPKRRDFAFESLLANAVLRWEYRPGSTLFVVWSHSRFGEDDAVRLLTDPAPSPFATPTLDQLGDAFALFPENVFLVKLSYLLMR